MFSSGEAVLQLVGAILGLIVVLLLAWVLLSWLSRRLPGVSGGAGRMIQILDRVSVGRNSVILLVRAGGKVFLVAVSDHAVEKLCEFDDEAGEFVPAVPAQAVPFSDALRDAAKKFGFKGKRDDNGDGEGGE
ncbi:flagellar biosynthetic protein FliO [Ruminococcaceae bacterium OttesenSCG-928-O06]|nr:flagellar biosynthetic protein FliO [Ruminococcaceae bacterium OttesenSCG-928-O06]